MHGKQGRSFWQISPLGARCSRRWRWSSKTVSSNKLLEATVQCHEDSLLVSLRGPSCFLCCLTLIWLSCWELSSRDLKCHQYEHDIQLFLSVLSESGEGAGLISYTSAWRWWWAGCGANKEWIMKRQRWCVTWVVLSRRWGNNLPWMDCTFLEGAGLQLERVPEFSRVDASVAGSVFFQLGQKWLSHCTWHSGNLQYLCKYCNKWNVSSVATNWKPMK